MGASNPQASLVGPIMTSMYVVEKWHEQNDSCAVEEFKVVTSRLMWEAFLPTRAMVECGPGLLSGTMSGSMVLSQPEAV